MASREGGAEATEYQHEHAADDADAITAGDITCSWFSEKTGIYTSKHPAQSLPTNPNTDAVSFIFSHLPAGAGATAALVDALSGSSISYADLPRLVSATAAALRDLGLRSGDTVLILLPNSILFPVVFLAVLAAGAVAAPTNPLSSGDELARQAAVCRPAMAVVGRRGGRLISALRGVRIAIVDPDCHCQHHTTRKSIICDTECLPQEEENPPRVNGAGDMSPAPLVIRQSDTAVILFSSGSTGPSKGVMISHANLIAMVELFVRFEAASGEVYLAVLPMFHVYGMSLFAAGLFSAGATVVVMNGAGGGFDADVALDAVERYGVTHLPAVPPVISSLVRRRCRRRRIPATLRQVSCGAAPLSEKLVGEFLGEFPGVDLIQGYGMTESTAVGSRGMNVSGRMKKYGSVGLLAPNMEAMVVDCRTGAFLPPGSSGELWLRGQAVMKGYLNDGGATSSAIDGGGWLKTGDVARFDDEGYIYIVDRLKDMIKYKGFQVAPADLEATLITHPDIIDAAVTSREDEDAGEIPVAFVVRSPGSSVSSDEIKDFVARRVASYKKVREVVFVKSIPRSIAGKILRRMLKESHSGTTRCSRI